MILQKGVCVSTGAKPVCHHNNKHLRQMTVCFWLSLKRLQPVVRQAHCLDTAGRYARWHQCKTCEFTDSSSDCQEPKKREWPPEVKYLPIGSIPAAP